MMPKPDPVPRYALFGETPVARFDDTVHCETIAARSSRYEWEISPHRHPTLIQILLINSGQVDLTLAELRSKLPGPALIVAPPGIVHGFRFAPGTLGYVVTFSDRFAERFAGDQILRDLLFEPRAFDLPEALAARLQVLCDQMLQAGGAARDADLLRGALAEAFVRIVAEAITSGAGEHADELVDRFRTLVQQHLPEQPSLRFLARRLNVTERTLSRRVKATLGVAPGRFIDDRIAIEATNLLRFTNASCCEVAEELGFADPSYFSRFYARLTGRRPSEVKSGAARS